MKWSCCSCGRGNYVRSPRSWWMRFLFTRRLYHCLHCGQTLFIQDFR